jgi:hypothetical protein
VHAQSGQDFGEQPFRESHDADYHQYSELASASQTTRPADTVSSVGDHDGACRSSSDLLRGGPENRAVTWTHGLSHVGVARDYFGRPHGLRRGSLHRSVCAVVERVIERHCDGNIGGNFKNGNG